MRLILQYSTQCRMIYNLHTTFRDVGIERLGERGRVLSDYVKSSKLKNYVLLNTCNRVELYSTANLELDRFTKCCEVDAVRHLFKVACGLDSMILGENEILGQVKKAKKEAEDEGHLNGELLNIFDCAVKLGSRARAKTKISKGKTSIASLAVEYGLSQYPVNEVLVIGSGAVGSKIACALKNKGVRQIFLANRRLERAKRVAKRVSGVVVDYRRLPDFLNKVSVVFTATSAPHAIIKPEMMPSREILFIDLAVPYDVSEEVDKLEGVRVVRLNYFKEIAEKNALKKVGEVRKVEEMIDNAVERLISKNVLRHSRKSS